MSNDNFVTLREFLLHSNLNLPSDLHVFRWCDSERSNVCVSLHRMTEPPTLCGGVSDPTFGKIIPYAIGRSIPLDYLDLPINVNLQK